MKNKSFAVLSSFILKVVALATMTIDHVGYILGDTIGYNFWLVTLFRLIGRLALPLFCFMITEGVIHTKKIGNYFLRLGIMGTLVSAALIVIEYAPLFDGMSMRSEGNIFVDLLLGAIAVFFLSRDKWYLKLLSIIPLGIGIAAFFVQGLEFQGTLVHWFPFFLRPQYQFYGILLIILFYVAYMFKDIFLKQYSNNSGIPVESLQGTTIDRYASNLLAFAMLVFATLGYFFIGITAPGQWVYWDVYLQNAAIISGALILLYNGTRGYNAKWFQYGSYLYYPLHMLIIYGLATLLL